MGSRGCERELDSGPGGAIPPGECAIPEELAHPREWNVLEELPVCGDVGYAFPCSCESYGGSYPENIINGREAYDRSGFPSCKPHYSWVDPLLKYALPGCALYVQLDGIHARWHDFNSDDDDVTFDLCPDRQIGFGYFGESPNSYFLPEIRSDGNFRRYFIARPRREASVFMEVKAILGGNPGGSFSHLPPLILGSSFAGGIRIGF